MLKVYFILFMLITNSSFVYAINLKDVIKITLEKESSIIIKKENIANYKGLYLQSKQNFDTTVNLSSNIQRAKSAQDAFISNNTINNEILNYNVYLNKYFETGYDVKGGIRYNESKMTDNSLHQDYNYQKNEIFFSISKALLKNSSREVITSSKQQAQYDLDMSVYQYKQQINSSLYNSIVAYWEFVYAYEKSKLDLESSKRAKVLIENINELIKADAKPRADALQPKANLNSKTLILLNTQQLVSDQRYNIGLKLGHKLEENLAINFPSDNFPKPTMANLKLLKNRDYYISLALKKRIDLKLLNLEIKKAKLNIVVAKDESKSNLDLKLDASYAGTSRDKNDISSLGNYFNNGLNGNSINLSLEYKFPIENSYAKGLYISNLSALSQSKLKYKELKREIKYEISKLLDQIKVTILAYKEIEASIVDYSAAFKNEKIKYTMGFSTILDVIQTEDTLYGEKLKRLDILKNYALQIAKLHYITSNIINNNKNLNIDYTKFFVIRSDKNE